jgi:hypothetical protein
MTLETLIRNACEDWSGEAQVPSGLAELALRRRSRRRSLKVGLAAGSTALLIGAAAVLFAVHSPAPRSSAPVGPARLSTDTSLHADLDNTFPQRLVAAGNTAIASYYTGRLLPSAKKPETFERTWYLYNPTSGRYEKTGWAFLDVAAGMHQAAVLEGPLPASRVGLLDLKSQRVTRWIPVEHPVGAVAWAPDGRNLLLTAYGENPDRVPAPSTRTGFYIVDATGKLSAFRVLPQNPDNLNYRQDLGWSRDGSLVWAPTVTDPPRKFYDLTGRPRSAPAYENLLGEDAGLSPDGTMTAAFGPAPGPAVTITKVRDGSKVAVLPIEQAWAWADNKHLFAIGCDPQNCTGKGEFRNRLLLVGLDGKITPLTGYRRSDQPGAWCPVFTHR